jgi:hypothetical protein
MWMFGVVAIVALALIFRHASEICALCTGTRRHRAAPL